ncbi:hypothetical protein OG21DRAFT_1497572 [Imleria badia]|nr:hypothetical protein OG21DRAFT_1497572 [Imleria badia]
MEFLPSEVICHILCFLSPRDIIRLRLVSKQFYDLTYDLAIWKTLYTNARLPRPPGPFPSQTLQFLERTLVQSEWLAHSWTTQPMGDISSVGIRIPGASDPPIIIYGKWLIGCESSSKFVAHNLDSNAEPHSAQLLWESASPINTWDACSVVFAGGLHIHGLFRIATDALSEPWKLLEFRVNGDSLYHTFTLDVPTRNFTNALYIEGGYSPFSYIDGRRLLFDAETRSFYKFPEFKSALVKVPPDSRFSDPLPWITMLTKTHIISLSFHADRTVSPAVLSTLVQAFTVPRDPHPVHNEIGILRLSHEGVTRDHLQGIDLIRNSVVNPVEGTTSIRLLHQFFEGDNLYLSCIDLTLPGPSSPDTVLPMNIDLQDIGHVNHASFGMSMHHARYVESSDDGHVRGFLRFSMPLDASGNMSAHYLILRFTIDASRSRCVAVLGQISVPQWLKTHDPPWSRHMLFDGVRGRWHYDRRFMLEVDDDEAAFVINIK